MYDHKYAGDIDNAAYEIGQFCRRWGKIQVTQTKEKYGTARVYCHFGISTIHDLIWTGHSYNRWEQKLGKFGKVCFLIDWNIIYRIIKFTRANYLISRYQAFIYRLAYKRAMKKYPHIKGAIKHGADFHELLTDLCTKP